MQGEKTISLGTVGDYEIGAKWKWKLQFDTVSKILLTTSIILLVIVATGTLLWVQCSKLSIQQEEWHQMKLDLQKVQSKILQELDEVMKFKQDFDLLSNTMEWRKDSNREKRNAIDRSKQIKNSDPSTNELTKTDRSSSKFNNFSSTSIGVYTVHLERTDSENYYMIGSNGIVNRWIPQQSHLLNPSDIKLSHFNSTLIIPADGLYNIYAQLCFVKATQSNSFEIRAIFPEKDDSLHSEIIAQCHAGTSHVGGEVSCYTSVNKVLKKGSKIFIQVLQKKRALFMRDSKSFLGITKLGDFNL